MSLVCLSHAALVLASSNCVSVSRCFGFSFVPLWLLVSSNCVSARCGVIFRLKKYNYAFLTTLTTRFTNPIANTSVFACRNTEKRDYTRLHSTTRFGGRDGGKRVVECS